MSSFVQLYKYILGVCLVLTYSVSGIAQTSEADYAALIHEQLAGEREVSVYSGRVDLVTETHAYEIEWAKKWKDAIGQALWYGLQTNKKPGIILIMEENAQFKYVQMLQTALDYGELSETIDVKVWPLDFE